MIVGPGAVSARGCVYWSSPAAGHEAFIACDVLSQTDISASFELPCRIIDSTDPVSWWCAAFPGGLLNVRNSHRLGLEAAVQHVVFTIIGPDSVNISYIFCSKILSSSSFFVLWRRCDARWQLWLEILLIVDLCFGTMYWTSVDVLLVFPSVAVPSQSTRAIFKTKSEKGILGNPPIQFRWHIKMSYSLILEIPLLCCVWWLHQNLQEHCKTLRVVHRRSARLCVCDAVCLVWLDFFLWLVGWFREGQCQRWIGKGSRSWNRGCLSSVSIVQSGVWRLPGAVRDGRPSRCGGRSLCWCDCMALSLDVLNVCLSL